MRMLTTFFFQNSSKVAREEKKEETHAQIVDSKLFCVLLFAVLNVTVLNKSDLVQKYITDLEQRRYTQ